MIGVAQFFSLIFIFISANSYFVCSTPHKWELTNSANNVQRFGQFIDDMFKNYNGFVRYNISFKMRKMLLYYTFVNCVSEIAYFRVINSNPEVCANLRLGLRYYGHRQIIEQLEQHIANEINKNILCPEEAPLPQAVVDQLLMLSFTFALRFIASVDLRYYDFFGYWQTETLLSAYKILATSNDDTNGVFPFQIFKISSFKSLRVIEFTNQKITNHTSEPNQYIENFKFLLKLSDYTLTLFEVYKLLETILIEAKGMDNESNVRALGEQPRALYTFVKQYFVDKIDSNFSLLKPNFFRKQSTVQTSKKKLLRCALVRFGKGLDKRTYDYSEFTNYFDDMKNECKKVDLKLRSDSDSIFLDMLFKISFFAIEFELFHEPLTNYPKFIAKDDLQFKGFVVSFADALRKMVVDLDSENNNDYSSIANGLFKSNNFKTLYSFLQWDKNLRKLELLREQNNSNLDKKSFLNDLRVLLDEIIEEYSYTTSACQGIDWMPNNSEHNIQKSILKFGQIFFESFQKYSDEVKYDGKDQLMVLPQMLAELLLERLYTVTQEVASICLIGNKLDFVQTMRKVVSPEQLEFVRINPQTHLIVNAQFFKLLFSLAYRLSLQIKRSDLTRKYLKAFGFAYKCIQLDTPTENYSFFEFKTNILHKMVEINLPNWKLPEYMQNRIINELQQANVKENFNFIFSLSDYTATLYELLKMAKKLGEMKKNHEIKINSSESKIFVEIMKYLKQLQEPIQINPENEFCVLAYFVEDLLVEFATENQIPNVESIELAIAHFMLTKEEFCTEDAKENDVKKYFDENFVNGINIDFSPRDELQQIVPEIVKEIKQMLQDANWNYANLKRIKIVEWDLLKFDLHKMGNDQKWEEIKQLRGEWKKAFNNWYFKQDKVNTPNFEEKMKKLIQILEKIIKKGN